jgi:hypothetical protein
MSPQFDSNVLNGRPTILEFCTKLDVAASYYAVALDSSQLAESRTVEHGCCCINREKRGPDTCHLGFFLHVLAASEVLSRG